MTIKMKSELFDCLKWIVMVVIPAATTAYVGLASIWHWPFADEIAKTSAVLCAFLGALLGISNLQYRQEMLEVGEGERTEGN